MSYEKTTWQNGDTITAEKLNNIENGIAGSIMNVGLVMEAGSAPTLNKTWKEICDHIALGGIVIINSTPVEADGYTIDFITGVISYIDENENHVYAVFVNQSEFLTDNENGYPVYTQTGDMSDSSQS